MAAQHIVTFSALPRRLSELQALPQAALREPWDTAALFLAAMDAYAEDRNAALEMVDFLRGPRPLSPMDKQFLQDRMRDGAYVPRSFFRGASPQNNYTPDAPLTLVFEETPYTWANEGYCQLWIRSGGADSPRSVQLRRKPSTGQWFLWEQMLLAQIRVPAAEDPWA